VLFLRNEPNLQYAHLRNEPKRAGFAKRNGCLSDLKKRSQFSFLPNEPSRAAFLRNEANSQPAERTQITIVRVSVARRAESDC
jgi:hypothetical protein